MVISVGTPQKDVIKEAPACRCRACSIGCEYGSGILVDDDLENLAAFLGISVECCIDTHLDRVEQFNKEFFRPKLACVKGKPYGRCTFFESAKGCTVHKAKPLQCKVSSGCNPSGAAISSWFVVNKLLDTDDPEAVRQYASFLDGGGTLIEGGRLQDLVPDKKRLAAIRSYEILK
ncbi:MAG: hypothetical protein ABIC95_05535 [archaeon]